MLVTFKSKSYANITMFGEVGITLLKLMAFGSKVPGAIVASDLPKALENLQSGLQSIPKDIAPNHESNDDQPAVSLHKRALPLIELLQAAIVDENNVRWQ